MCEVLECIAAHEVKNVFAVQCGGVLEVKVCEALWKVGALEEQIKGLF